jgi:hypothetical protein
VAVAAGVQQHLRKLLGHDQVKVRPYGKRLFIQLDLGDEVETVARLTEHRSNQYGIDFRTHQGRWEPLPEEGTLKQMTEAVASQLGPYLTPDNY